MCGKSRARGGEAVTRCEHTVVLYGSREGRPPDFSEEAVCVYCREKVAADFRTDARWSPCFAAIRIPDAVIEAVLAEEKP